MLRARRLGDTYPSSMIQVQARMYLYRWYERSTSEGEVLSYEVWAASFAWPRLVQADQPCPKVRNEVWARFICVALLSST